MGSEKSKENWELPGWIFGGIGHDDVIKWKHFPRYWPFVRGIHRSPVDSPHKGQWRGALIFSWICAWTNGWANNRDAGDLRRHRDHYDVTVMCCINVTSHFMKLIWNQFIDPQRRKDAKTMCLAIIFQHWDGTGDGNHFCCKTDTFILHPKEPGQQLQFYQNCSSKIS